MAYLNRIKAYEKKEPTKDAKKVYIFCEGEKTEIAYFKYFRGFSSNIDIIPIPSEDGKTNPLHLQTQAAEFFSDSTDNELSEEYQDEVWFVIDTDEWNIGDKIEQLKAFCKGNARWFVVQSNPCFELWLYYHFYDQKPASENVAEYSTFKEFVDAQIKGGFDARRMPAELETAIKNSAQNFEPENGQPKLYSTEVHILGAVINSFVKEQLDEIKQKMAAERARNLLKK